MNIKQFIVVCLFAFMATAQGFGQADTIFNQPDDKGMKQGHWRKYYDNGKLMYQGFFKDNKPVGEMKRYYKSGGIQAIMIFNDNGISAKATLFYEDGERSAEGWYWNMQKDSLWKYYSFYSGILVSEEIYKKGKKDSIQKNYFPNGNISEELEYKNGIKDGIWKQYFEDGKLKMSTTNMWNKVNGRYTFYYPSGERMLVGIFDDNKKEGPWVYFDENGKEKFRLHYKYGEINPEDQKKLLEQDQEFLKQADENMGKFEDPSVEDFFKVAY